MSTNTEIESRTIWFYVVGLANLVYAVRRSEVGLPSIHETRKEIRALLKEAHEFLLEKTPERNAYFVIFALVAWVDETMAECVQSKRIENWEDLQGELFEITDAGTLFYQYIDYFRGRNDIPMVIYEVFYFCLKDGFKGSKINEPELRAVYMEELRAHIPTEKVPSIADREIVKVEAKRRVPVFAYYVASLLVLLLFRFLLELIPLEVSI